ncbi:MAG TPA: HAD-IIIC family phosphatase, partial [Streptosporangiaceae bacterium]
HLLSQLDPDEVLRAHPATRQVTLAITGHGTLSQLVPPLTAELARHGLLARVHSSAFDSYVADLLDPGSDLYRAEPDLIVCVLDPLMIFDEVPVPWRPGDVQRVLGQKIGLVSQLAARCASASRATLVLNTLPLPRRFTAQLIDHKARARLGAIWRQANIALLDLAASQPAVVVIDLDPLIAEGVPAQDARLSVYVSAHLSAELLTRYARELGHLARHLTGQASKALALDLDGTVWGGVLGEAGPEGIEVADGYRGAAFTAFQRVLRQLGAQGVLLSAISKNDPGPVAQVLRDHPRMTLREEDFVRVAANWLPKHDNLTQIAASLNIGADSFVFVDDSAHECGLIRRAEPGLPVIQVSEEPAWHVTRLLADGWFDTLDLTAEDRERPARYRAEAARQEFIGRFDSVADYVRQLGVKVRIAPVTGAEVARVSQLTLRTNQFNLTTARLQPAQVRELMTDPAAQVLAIYASDMFGDSGLVGAVFTRRDADVVQIVNFVLSCRVFSRGIEQACLASVLADARAAGASAVLAGFRPSKKNAKVRDFYPDNGFVLVSSDPRETVYRHDLAAIGAVDHIELIRDREEDRW